MLVFDICFPLTLGDGVLQISCWIVKQEGLIHRLPLLRQHVEHHQMSFIAPVLDFHPEALNLFLIGSSLHSVHLLT